MPPHSHTTRPHMPRPQAPSEDAVWEDGQWLPMIDPRDKVPTDSPLINLDHPSPDLSRSRSKRAALYDALLVNARQHFKLTGRHLPIYPDIAELYAALAYGIKFGRSDEAGSEGRLGDDHYTVKVISPTNTTETVTVQMSGNFSHLAVVKITSGFHVTGRVIARKEMPGTSDQMRKIRWSSLPEGPANHADR